MKQKDVIAPQNAVPTKETAETVIYSGGENASRPINQRLANALSASRSPMDLEIPLGVYAKLRKPKA